MAGRLKRGVPFGYRPGRTVIHRMPAGLKLVFVIVISAFAFASVYGLAASILLILTACALARIPPHKLLKGSKPLVILSLCIILLKTINKEGFIEGLFTASSLFVPFAAAALLFSVTTMRELRLSLALVETIVIRLFSLTPRVAARKLFMQTANMPSAKGKAYTPFFSLAISLMLGFIPRFFDLWDDANLACDSRSCKRGLRRLFLLLPLVTERMMEAAANTALALEARGLSL